MGRNCFERCYSLSSFRSIGGEPIQVSKIGDHCFHSCTDLVDIQMGSELKELGNGVFKECTFKNIILPDSISYIGIGVFEKCINLESINIPESVRLLPTSCFEECKSLSAVRYPSELVGIGDLCFYGCSSLKIFNTSNDSPDFEITTNLTRLGGRAFYSCGFIKIIKLGNLQKLSVGCFTGNPLESAVLPTTIERIEEDCFKDCVSLRNIAIPGTITYISPTAFSGCSNLTGIQKL